MITVFHARSYDRFTEIMICLKGQKLHTTNPGFNPFEGGFSNKANVKPPIQLRRKKNFDILKDSFS